MAFYHFLLDFVLDMCYIPTIGVKLAFGFITQLRPHKSEKKMKKVKENA